MSNRLRLTSILTPPADDTWRAGAGYVRFDPADDVAAGWSVPGYRPGWPIIGVPNGSGTGLQEINGGDIFVPGDEPGDSYAGPWMRVSYELQTNAGTWHRGSYRWRAVSTGGGSIDMRTPAPELEPPTVTRPGVPATALTTADLGVRVAEQSSVTLLQPPATHPLIGTESYGAQATAARDQLSSWTRTTPTLVFGRASAIITFGDSAPFAALSLAAIPGWLLVTANWTAVETATAIPAAAARNGGPRNALVKLGTQREFTIDVETVWAKL